MEHGFSIGSTVRPRGQRWQVVAAEPLPQKAGPPLVRLRLRSVEGALAGDELPLLHPIDPVELETIPELDLEVRVEEATRRGAIAYVPSRARRFDPAGPYRPPRSAGQLGRRYC